jgi:hypothetical protein
MVCVSSGVPLNAQPQSALPASNASTPRNSENGIPDGRDVLDHQDEHNR